MKKIISLLLSALMLLSLTSCGYEISIKKKGEGDDQAKTSSSEESTTRKKGKKERDRDDDDDFDNIFEDILDDDDDDDDDDRWENATRTGEPTTDPGDIHAAVPEDFKPTGLSVKEILRLYKGAVNDVKLKAPGYLRTEEQKVSSVNALGDIDSQLANRIVNLVATEVIGGVRKDEARIKVLQHDDVEVRETFPLFGKDTGCELENTDIIRSAECYSNGDTYRVVIRFNDQFNPEPFVSDFGKIMTPVARENTADNIAEYMVVLDMDQYQFDINYTESELVCDIDIKTNHVLSLVQKMNMAIDINLNLDLIVFKTKNIEVTGNIYNTLKYEDFKW